jgi:RNA polymerase sigma factor (sigma-70 family)
VEDLTGLIATIRAGDVNAYESIVRAFQNMAVGYSYALLGDFQLAEDAAQEAFITAYFELPTLREPQAFPGWFRRILLKHIDRSRRVQRTESELDDQIAVADWRHNPVDMLERREMERTLQAVIQCLPTAQREVVTLFYIGEYSHRDMSAFLDIPISTVKMRLYYARQSLKQKLITVIEDLLPNQRPSKNNQFTEKIMSYEVQSKELPAMKVLSISREVFVKELQAHLDGSINAMMVVTEANGMQIAGLPLSIYHGTVSEEQSGMVEVCLPINGTMPTRDDMVIKELPATEAAYTTLTVQQAIFPGVVKAYEALSGWITNHNYNPSTPPREVYLNFNRTIFSPIASLDDPCVEINWPYI